MSRTTAGTTHVCLMHGVSNGRRSMLELFAAAPAMPPVRFIHRLRSDSARLHSADLAWARLGLARLGLTRLGVLSIRMEEELRKAEWGVPPIRRCRTWHDFKTTPSAVRIFWRAVLTRAGSGAVRRLVRSPSFVFPNLSVVKLSGKHRRVVLNECPRLVVRFGP